MGCRAISPELVGLASRLEGKPFHLVATDRQRNERDDQVRYLKSLGLADDTPNFTATSGGGHPAVKGNGYVPYYMIFDHDGRLVRDHMGGAYHGGDGLEMIEWVEKLLEAAPAIYLGREPFVAEAELAGRISSGQKLAKAVGELEDRLAGGEKSEELDRILAGVTRWRDARLAEADRLLAERPSAVLDHLKSAAKELDGTKLADPLDARHDALKADRSLKDAIAIERAWRKARAQLESVDERRRASAVAATRKKLEREIEGKEELPIAKTVRDYLDGL